MVNQYCVYLTIYRGNKLPMFYIGYTRLDKISNGYRGSVSSKEYKYIWRQELKQNKHLFDIRIIKMFDNIEMAAIYEEKLIYQLNAHNNPLYINLSASGRGGWKIGLLSNEVRKETNKKISAALTGKKLSIEHRKSLSDSHKGQKAWNKGMGTYAAKIAAQSKRGSKEHRNKVSQSIKQVWAKRKGIVSS